MKTLFCEIPWKYWFAATNTRNHNTDYRYMEKKLPETYENKFAARNIRDDKTLANLAKISHMLANKS